MKLSKHRKALWGFVLLSALSLLPVAAQAQIEKATVRIDGFV